MYRKHVHRNPPNLMMLIVLIVLTAWCFRYCETQNREESRYHESESK